MEKNKKINTVNFRYSRYKNIFYGFLVFVLVFGLSSSIIANDTSKDNNIVKMGFSDNHDLLAQNDLKKSYALHETKFIISKQFETKDISVNISPEECELIDVDGWHYLKIGNLSSFTKQGDPQLPVKTLVVKLPKNSEVMDISVISGNYKEILNEINIIPTPQPLKLIANKNISEENYKQIYNSEIYNSNSYFPGKIFSYDIGNDNENKYILIRFYPIQYMPQEKKAVLITDAKIEVSYQTTNDASSALSSSAEAVIITSHELKSQADNLAAFHNGGGILTEVVTTQYIWDNYNAASDSGYEGYNDSFLPGRNNITKYNYTLAKKIVSFLNQSSNIKYVILFGNARIVPPSYYIYDKQTDCGYECVIDYYNSWIPTDYFYASPDYDLIPNYMVGRIPVDNTNEAINFVQKINKWNLNLNWSWFKNVAVAGGRLFLDTHYGSGRYDEIFTGEMDCVNIINMGYFSGMNITKLFRSDSKFNKSSMKDVLSGNYGMVYHDDHGAGDRLVTDKESLNTSDIMAISPNSKVPIVVSASCMNGAYDSYIIPNNFYGYTQPMSIGESIVKSNAGGIAYIGGSRTNYGGPSLYLKNGYVQSLKQNYMIEIDSNIFKIYHEGSDSIGNLTKSAVLQYVIDNDFSEDPYNKRTLFEFVLLGDPASKIPVQQSEEYTDKPKLNVVNPQGKRDSYFAYGNMPTYSLGGTVTVTCQANSSSVKMKLVAVDKWFNETIDVQNVNVVNGNATYIFTVNNTHLYLVRCIDNNSKEGWLYVNQPFVVFTDSYSDQPEYIDYDWYYDYLTINVGINVTKAGEYLIGGNLCDKVNCVYAFSKVNLTSSNNIVKLKFAGHEIYKLKMNGYYQLKYLTLYNNKGHLDKMQIDYRFNPYNTSYKYYLYFEHEISKTADISSSSYTDDDCGINTDSTSYYNYLITNITVYVSKAGYYNVGGTIYGYRYSGDNYMISQASNYTYLNEGYQTVSLKFDGRLIYYRGNFYNGATLQYAIFVGLSDSGGNSLGYKFLKTKNNYEYNNFERFKDIFVSGYYSSSVIDTNSNTKYEYFTFTARVNIPSSGYYGIGASLYDSKYHTIDSAFTVKNLTLGYHDIQLNFSGWKIYSNGINGHYKIFYLYIVDENSTLDYKPNPHNTSSYEYTSFESTPWKILLVDDDEGKYYEDDYKDALDANGYTYKYWDVYGGGNITPDLTTLSQYNVVIWFTGKDNSTTLTPIDQSNLQSYLDEGGKLFISGQDIGYNIGNTSFYQNYLHAIYKGNNKNTGEITGIYGEYISDGLDINQFGDSPDVISVKSEAVKIFDYVGNSYFSYPAAGLKYDGKYRLVYLPFGFESASKQYTLMDRIIKWLLQSATFKNYANYGEDTDCNGLHNYLVINVTLNVSNAGNYTIGGYLFDPNLKHIDDYETNRYLGAGMQTVQLKFKGYKIYNNGVSGNYQLKFLTVENVDDVYKYPVDYAINPYITSSYSYVTFDRTFTGNYKESTENIYEEECAKYRYLTINVSVNITSPGNYMISGELYDNNSLFITKAGNFTYLNSGIQTVKLNFKGFDIYHNEANGKYYLKALLIKNIGETIDYKETAYTTTPYNYGHFKIAVCSDGNNSIVDGQCSITKPKYCLNGTLIDNCSLCRCQNGQICNTSKGSCYTPIQCNCSDCSDCTNQLNNNSCAIVVLKQNITNYSGICINNPINFTNRIFDCQGHSIDGNDIFDSLPDAGIYLNGEQNNTIRNCVITDFAYGIYLNSSSNNTIISNTLNSNNKSGIYIFNNSNFNQILNNQILNNNESGITISNCNSLGNCYVGNSNNTIKRNKILNNTVGIFSNASNSIINNNVVSNNTNFDFYSPYWYLSYGDNNYCEKADGWNDTSMKNAGKTGCSCKYQDRAKDIFDAVEMLEYLSGQKDLSKCDIYYNLNEYDEVDLLDVFNLIDKIVTEG